MYYPNIVKVKRSSAKLQNPIQVNIKSKCYQTQSTIITHGIRVIIIISIFLPSLNFSLK